MINNARSMPSLLVSCWSLELGKWTRSSIPEVKMFVSVLSKALLIDFCYITDNVKTSIEWRVSSRSLQQPGPSIIDVTSNLAMVSVAYQRLLTFLDVEICRFFSGGHAASL